MTPTTMKSFSVCIVITLCHIIYTHGQITECKKQSNCACVSNIGRFDLSPLANIKGARFQDVKDNMGKAYSWNPCISFTEGGCSNVAVCEKFGADPPSYFSLGTQDSAKFSVKDGQLTVEYSADTLDGSVTFLRTATISLICDPTKTPGNLTIVGENPPATGNYMMTLRSIHACPITVRADNNIQADNTTTAATIAPITGNSAATIGPVTHNHNITAAHIVTPSVTPAKIVTPTATPAHIIYPTPMPNEDITDIKLLLVGQVVIMVFIMLFIVLLVLVYTYRVCCGKTASKSAYDNL